MSIKRDKKIRNASISLFYLLDIHAVEITGTDVVIVVDIIKMIIPDNIWQSMSVYKYLIIQTKIYSKYWGVEVDTLNKKPWISSTIYF